jgi:N6-L-threonylcarbamoyladenine synthase
MADGEKMNILAFESSCDETSAAVVRREDDKFIIKSNIIASQVETHKLYGGVVPEIASRAHIEAISSITYEALEAAGITMDEIDAVAVTANPGLIGALLVGVNFAKALAIANGKPLVSVDHIKGHIATCYLDGNGNVPTPPFIALTVSGGHTGIYLVEDYGRIKLVGSTRDDAIGESFDKIGRIIGIPYPAGKGFDALSSEGFKLAVGDCEDYLAKYKKSEAYKSGAFTLPSPAVKDDSFDFSFSGLKTAAINLIHRYEQLGNELPKAEFAARYTYEAVEAVAKKMAAAIDMYGVKEIALCGGVAANSHLRNRLSTLAKQKKIKLYVPPVSLCGDNAAMIGAQGYYELLMGNFADSSLNASASDSIE